MNTYDVTNYLAIAGTVTRPFELEYTSHNGKNYWSTIVQIRRLSEQSDFIPLSVPEELIDTNRNYIGKYVEAFGTLRAFGRYDESGKHHVSIKACPDELEICDTEEEHCNYVMIKGTLHKPAIYRITPAGREIADVLIKVTSPKRHDYINCIAWGRNALHISEMPVGTQLKVTGRLQSREYRKKLSDDEFEIRTAYELSISKFDEEKDNEESDS